MRRALPLSLLLLLLAACAHHTDHFGERVAAPQLDGTPPPAAGSTVAMDQGFVPLEPIPEVDPDDAESDLDDEDDGPVAEEQESREPAVPGTADLDRYSADLSDAKLAELWRDRPEALGCMSMGFADEGRLINGRPFPSGEDWIVVSPDKSWGTSETIAYVITAIEHVKARFPEAPRVRINRVSGREGGYLKPHKSHQSGRDVDLGFYYPTETPVRIRAREKAINVALNWELIKSLAVYTDIQLILVDRRVQRILYRYALRKGEDRGWLDSLFKRRSAHGRPPLIQHARKHRDHFHLRFYNPRAQELGRRVTPLLAQRPDQNLVMHRVRRGENLGSIARRYHSSVKVLKKANRLRSSRLKLSQVLRVPLRGPCTRCPLPPPLMLPERRLPPPGPTAEAN